MSALIALLAIMLLLYLGYFRWSAYISNKIFNLSSTEQTPAHDPNLQDNVDYMPVPKHILWGHHYASIAGAAPIIGPAVAIIWGWVPALIWVIFGTIFIGAVHDFGALILSTRNQGKSMGSLGASIIHPRVQLLFQCIIYFLIWVVLAVFAFAVGVLFTRYPQTVIPINFEIIVALAMGIMIYKFRVKSLIPSILALLALYAMILVGVQYPVDLTTIFAQDSIFSQDPITTWAIFLLIYAAIASVLPVWLLLQPRDYINAHQLIVGLGVLIIGLFISHPDMQAPAINLHPEGAPPMFPFIFITIACGAISGFHGLVASGTTSKQLNTMKDARVIGYGGMLGEGTLAVIATLAVAAGLSDWASHYHSWNSSGLLAISHFVEGATTFATAIGLPEGIAAAFIAVLVISFAATSMDTAARIQRYLIHELGQRLEFKLFKNRYLATLLAVGPSIPLVLAGKSAWGPLWLLFGTTNQLIGAISLLVIFVYLLKAQKPVLAYMIPMMFVLVVTTLSMMLNLYNWTNTLLQGEQVPLATLIIGYFIFVLECWIIMETIIVIRQYFAKHDKRVGVAV